MAENKQHRKHTLRIGVTIDKCFGFRTPLQRLWIVIGNVDAGNSIAILGVGVETLKVMLDLIVMLQTLRFVLGDQLGQHQLAILLLFVVELKHVRIARWYKRKFRDNSS